jgi:hypothetical protein
VVDLACQVVVLPLGEMSGSDLTLWSRGDWRVRSLGGGTRCCEHLTRHRSVRSCLRASDRHLGLHAGVLDRWRSTVDVKHGGHVASIQRPNAGRAMSGQLDRRVRSARVGLLYEPNGSISMEPL